MPFALFAQFAQTPTALAGDSGWVGAGLLGLVLAWLLFWHLPAKDKQLSEVLKIKDEQLAAKDERMEEQTRECEATIERIITKFDAELKAMRTEREKLIDFMRSRRCLDNPNGGPEGNR